jgi:hypothetical protein
MMRANVGKFYISALGPDDNRIMKLQNFIKKIKLQMCMQRKEMIKYAENQHLR